MEQDVRIWTHQRLGDLRGHEVGWQGEVDLPAFDRFAYPRRRATARPAGRQHLLIDVSDTDQPSPAAVEVALRVLEHQHELVDAIAAAFWESFNGRGPVAGWFGDLRSLVGLPPHGDRQPAHPADLLPLLRLTDGVYVRCDPTLSPLPLAHLMFDAPFEEEHGVGVLTDGDRIVGIGHSTDVLPFDWQEAADQGA